MWPGFDSPTRRHMWVEFVVSSCPFSEDFSPGSLVFLPPQKPTFPNSNSTWNTQTLLNELLELFGASWVNKLHYFILTFTSLDIIHYLDNDVRYIETLINIASSF